jgi:hypothetical protein
MVSDKPKEIARRDEQHLATGGSRDTAAFDGRSPMAGEDGKVHTMTPRPPETSLLKNALIRLRAVNLRTHLSQALISSPLIMTTGSATTA